MRAGVITLALLIGTVPAGAQPRDVVFDVPPGITLATGEPVAYSLCLGRAVDVPQPGQVRANLEPAQSPCGSSFNPSPWVHGGNAPYYFVLDSGSSLPMGMVLDKNGVLRGTLRETAPPPFRVCAVDQSARESCQTVSVRGEPARPTSRQQPEARGGSAAAMGLLVGAGIAAVAAGVVIANAHRCESGQTDCGDGHCCEPGHGCCGVFGGEEVCCSGDSPHYCPSTNRCYRYMPSCDFEVCGGVVSAAPGAEDGGITLRRGRPDAPDQPGAPAVRGCRRAEAHGSPDR